MADVIEQGDAGRRPRAGLLVGLAAVLALGALLVAPLGNGDVEPRPRPAPSRTASASKSPSPRTPVTAELTGPLRTAPTGLHVFGLDDGQLVRLDVDSGETVPIRGMGNLTRRQVYAQPWGEGTAVVKIGPTEGYDNRPGTVFLLRRGADRATPVGTAHVLVRGARKGDLVFVTEKSFEEGGTAVTYDSAGRRRSTRRVPPRTNVVADSDRGLVTYTHGGALLELRGAGRSRTFRDRHLLAGTSRFMVSTRMGCASPCQLLLTDLTTGAEEAIGAHGNGIAVEVSVAPGERHALLRMYDTGSDGAAQSERIYHLDVATRDVTEVAGAMQIRPLQRMDWAGDGRGAFLQSEGRWAYWTVDGGLELLERRVGLEVVGVS